MRPAVEMSVSHCSADKVSGKHNTRRVLAPTYTAFVWLFLQATDHQITRKPSLPVKELW